MARNQKRAPRTREALGNSSTRRCWRKRGSARLRVGSESDFRLDLHDGQMPCDIPRASSGTSTSTAAGRFWTAHHAHTVRIGTAWRRKDAPRTKLRWAIALLLLLDRRVSRGTRNQASRVPLLFQRGRTDALANCLGNRVVDRCRVGAPLARIETMGTLSHTSEKSCYTLASELPFTQLQNTARSLTRDDRGALLANHHARGVGRRVHDLRHDRRVGDS